MDGASQDGGGPGGFGSGGGGGGEGDWQTVKAKTKYSRKGKGSDEPEFTTKAYRVVRGGKTVEVLAYQYQTTNGRKIVYGSKGEKHCLVCRALRDHFAEGCPGFFCHKCHHHGHWAKDCPEKLKCGWCGSAEHPLEECPKGGKSFSGGTKRSSAEAPSALPPKRASTAAPAAAVASSSVSYASRLARSSVETTTSMAIGSFLDNFKGYGNHDFESQLKRLDGQVEDERRRFERRMAEFAAKRKDIIRNRRNAVKLTNLLAQLKEVQQDLDDSSDEMDESAPPSSPKVPSINVATVSNVETVVKVEKEGVDGGEDRTSEVDQVGVVDHAGRVEPLSTDSGGSAAGTYPVSVATDAAGVSGIGSSAVSGGSAAGIHPVSAAGDSDKIVDTDATLGNSSRRASSSNSPGKDSQGSKSNPESTEFIENLDWFDETEPK